MIRIEIDPLLKYIDLDGTGKLVLFFCPYFTSLPIHCEALLKIV